MKRTCSIASSVILLALAACSGTSSGPSATQPSSTKTSCTFAISPSTVNFTTGGGSQMVNVTASPLGCAPSTWSASTVSAALSVAPTSGSGNGSVTVTASPNTTSAQQTLTATIAGDTFTATLSAVACTYTFTANKPDQNGNTWIVSSDASQQGVTVTVTPNDGSCAAWRAASSADWITVSPASGATSTTVAINYSANRAGTGAQPPASARIGNVSFMRSDCAAPNCGLTVELNQGPPQTITAEPNCTTPVHAGDHVLCSLVALGGVAFADLSMFGGSAKATDSTCPACGTGPAVTYDFYFLIPANMTPGVKTFPIWVADSYGHRVNSTASIVVAAR